MIYSYFKTTSTKPPRQSFKSTPDIPLENPKFTNNSKKHRLIPLILARATAKTLKLTFEAIA